MQTYETVSLSEKKGWEGVATLPYTYILQFFFLVHWGAYPHCTPNPPPPPVQTIYETNVIL